MTPTPDLWRDMDRSFSHFGSWRPLLRQLDDIFNEAMDTRFDESPRSMTPQCDLEESADHYLLSFDMPGVDKDDIDIELQGQQLVISGERRLERERTEGRSHINERRFGRFERSVRLPQNVKADGIEAEYEDGVLRVAVPKTNEASRHRIPVREGNGRSLFGSTNGPVTKHADETRH